jgi:FtsP/CotA-like multicopper oxidase with cupredoxin domain
MTVNSTVPGPTIHVYYGEFVVVKVINLMDENTTVHFHGFNALANSL